MSLTIELDDELARQLREVAREEGVDPALFAASAIRERVRRSPFQSRRSEKQLLSEIGKGLPEAVWSEYRRLSSERRAEKLSEADREKLLRLTDQVENWHARRLMLVGELAKETGETVPTLMERLGLFTPLYA
jgi:predicted transcriptional regulator